jgi:diguanylate cyclase
MTSAVSATHPDDAFDTFTRDLDDICRMAGDALRTTVYALVLADAEDLSARFYEAMFADPQAAALLDHAVVNQRLHASMRRWLIELFNPEVAPAALAATQRRTGEVHARIGVPIASVGRGARVLKHAICERLGHSPLGRADLLLAALYVQELFDLAVDAMSGAFATNANRLARSEEGYRLFFLGQDMKAERERRRSELLEWAHQILQRYYWDQDVKEEGRDDHSQFSLWLRHKAAMLFDGAAEVDLMQADMARVERELLPQLSQVRASHADARAVVEDINRAIASIKELLGAMFDRYLVAEDGRDSVTALLNRRYFPAIARREIEVCNAQGGAFAVLMVDVDDFRSVVDAVGRDGANLVLTEAAAILQENLRAGDFVFRIGDDEFLILLVECRLPAAQRVADGLRRRFEETRFRGGGRADLVLTVSIGIAPFDGHPDYQRLLERADAAVARAKSAGGNRCELGD